MNYLRYSGEWHSSIPTHTILRNEDLSPLARLLWAILQSFASPDKPNPFPGHKLLMKHLKLSRTQLHVYQKELLDKGFLEIEKQRRAKAGKWASNVYVLKLPALKEKNGSRALSGRPNKTVFGPPDTVTPNTAKSVPGKNGESLSEKNGTRTVFGPTDTVTPNMSKSPRSISKTPVSPGEASPRVGVFIPSGEQGTAAGAAVGNGTEQDQQLAASHNITKLSKVLPCGIRNYLHLKQKPTFSAQALMDGKEFFFINELWEWSDIVWVVVNCVLKARANPKPAQGFDPWFYSRNFGHMPNKLFSQNQDNEYLVLRMAKELGYTLTEGFRETEILAELEKIPVG